MTQIWAQLTLTVNTHAQCQISFPCNLLHFILLPWSSTYLFDHWNRHCLLTYIYTDLWHSGLNRTKPSVPIGWLAANQDTRGGWVSARDQFETCMLQDLSPRPVTSCSEILRLWEDGSSSFFGLNWKPWKPKGNWHIQLAWGTTVLKNAPPRNPIAMIILESCPGSAQNINSRVGWRTMGPQ